MDGLSLLADAAAAGLVVTAAGDKLLIRGPRSADALARRLIEHKVAVLAALPTAKNVYVYETTTTAENAEGFVNVDNVDIPAAILAELRHRGLDLIAEPTGRVYLGGPPEAVAVLSSVLVEAMEANWPALRRLAAIGAGRLTSRRSKSAQPCPKCGTLELWQNLRRLALSGLRPTGPRYETIGAGGTP